MLPAEINNLSPAFSAPLSSRQSQKEESPSPSAPSVRVSEPAPPQINLFLGSEQYTNLEQLLKQSIGPVAPTILRKAVIQAANCQELVENLASYLLPQQQKQFDKRAMAILETSTVSSQTQPAKSSKGEYQTIDANIISKCERELAYSIGPIANFIIKQVLQSQPQISLREFVTKLAENISEPKQALEFERRILGQ